MLALGCDHGGFEHKNAIAEHLKERGFVYQGSEIYNGLANAWDYGPLGVELKNNTTYTLTLGNALKDLRGNAIAPPFQLAFSTGNHIDSLSLSGKVLLTQEMVAAKELPSIGLYPLGTERSKRNYLKKYRDSLLNAPDTVPFLTKEIPLFFTQADSNGFFKVIGLSPGKYRIVAFVDANGNRRLDQTTEPGGIYGDISLDSLFKDSLWLPLGNLDTSEVVLDSVKQLGATVIQPIFNAAVNPDSLKGCMLYGSNKKVLDSLQKILACAMLAQHILPVT